LWNRLSSRHAIIIAVGHASEKQVEGIGETTTATASESREEKDRCSGCVVVVVEVKVRVCEWRDCGRMQELSLEAGLRLSWFGKGYRCDATTMN
jgi:hypothetical protein